MGLAMGGLVLWISVCARQSLVFGSHPWREGRGDGASTHPYWIGGRGCFSCPHDSVYVSENSMSRHLSGLCNADGIYMRRGLVSGFGQSADRCLLPPAESHSRILHPNTWTTGTVELLASISQKSRSSPRVMVGDGEPSDSARNPHNHHHSERASFPQHALRAPGAITECSSR